MYLESVIPRFYSNAIALKVSGFLKATVKSIPWPQENFIGYKKESFYHQMKETFILNDSYFFYKYG